MVFEKNRSQDRGPATFEFETARRGAAGRDGAALVVTEVVVQGELEHPTAVEQFDRGPRGGDMRPARGCRSVDEVVVKPDAGDRSSPCLLPELVGRAPTRGGGEFSSRALSCAALLSLLLPR